MSSVSISAGSKTCWSQSGSTVKYESNLGPTVAATRSGGGLVTGVSASIGSTSVSNGKCTYPVTITLNYSIPDGYSETSSSSGATAATISGSAMVQYNGVPNDHNFSVSKTIYYKKNGPTEYTIKFVWSITGNDGIFYVNYSITFPSINVWNYISSFTSAVDTMYYTDNGYSETKRFSATITSSSNATKAWNEYENSMQYINDSTIVGSSGTSKTSWLYSNSSIRIILQEVCY